MYKVVKVDGWLRQQICTDGKASKYGKPKLFKTGKEAQKWIDKESYKGMSYSYEIVKAD